MKHDLSLIITHRHSLTEIQPCRNVHVLVIPGMLNHLQSSVYALTVHLIVTLHMHKHTRQIQLLISKRVRTNLIDKQLQVLISVTELPLSLPI